MCYINIPKDRIGDRVKCLKKEGKISKTKKFSRDSGKIYQPWIKMAPRKKDEERAKETGEKNRWCRYSQGRDRFSNGKNARGGGSRVEEQLIMLPRNYIGHEGQGSGVQTSPRSKLPKTLGCTGI